MKTILVISTLVMLGAGVLAVNSPAPEGGPSCLVCPDDPLPDECPACYQWVPQTCRQCGHCERIKGCRV
jgi:hypothetical protein